MLCTHSSETTPSEKICEAKLNPVGCTKYVESGVDAPDFAFATCNLANVTYVNSFCRLLKHY